MAKKSSRRANGDNVDATNTGDGAGGEATLGAAGQPTGRYLVTFKDGAEKAGPAGGAGRARPPRRGCDRGLQGRARHGADGQRRRVGAERAGHPESSLRRPPADTQRDGRPRSGRRDRGRSSLEFYIEAIAQLELDAARRSQYVRGFRDAAAALHRGLLRQGRGARGRRRARSSWSRSATRRRITWGLQATGVTRSRFTGRGIRVAVLDTRAGPASSRLPRTQDRAPVVCAGSAQCAGRPLARHPSASATSLGPAASPAPSGDAPLRLRPGR